MKAAVLYSTGLKVEDNIEIPSLRAGQVLVKLQYSGVCRSQLMEARGLRGPDIYYPHLLGHEGAGVVEAIGNSVTRVKVGQKVILTWLQGKGLSERGTRYKQGNIHINAGPVTTLSEFSVVSENRCVALPEGIPMDVAVLFGCAVPTGVGIVINEVKPVPGSHVAIFGLGGIGLSALMAMGLFDLQSVIAVDVEERKLELAKSLGATHTINASKKDPYKVILEITQGRGVDYAVEAAGIVSSIEKAFECVRDRGGQCIFATHPKAGDTIKLDPHALIRGKQIKGSWGGAFDLDIDMPKMFAFYKEGKLPLEKLLGNIYSLDEVCLAFDDLEARKVMRALVKVNDRA